MKKLKAFLDGLDEQKLYGILWKAYLVQAAVFLALAIIACVRLVQSAWH